MILFDNVSMDYGNNKGVFELNFDLKSGIIGFLGENGAGKTTTINLIMGFLKPDNGKIEIMNMDIWSFNNNALSKRHIGFLPNENILFPELTGRENLEYLSLLKKGNKNIYKELNEEIDYFKIAEFLDEPLKTYSTGMIKKLS